MTTNRAKAKFNDPDELEQSDLEEETPDDFDDLNFAEQDLRDCNFANRNLAGANFYNCDLRGCDFRNCNLVGANFEGVITGFSFKQRVLYSTVIGTTILGVFMAIVTFMLLSAGTPISGGPVWIVLGVGAVIFGLRSVPSLSLSVAKAAAFAAADLVAIFSALKGLKTLVMTEIVIFSTLGIIFLGFTVFFSSKAIRKIKKTKGTSFRNTDLSKARFNNAMIRDTDFVGAITHTADWTDAQVIKR